ncbi:DNA polymerase 3'-5' exonuclease subunit [Candidatus Mancarchaeum acidiphilum]|uniref:DNA polymerase 3'-5' exonuclease subunit n=1 Tax=Candidatus Mancarchaeum acidiphilum TaxID=1920749 RepID=A0A218NN52_9ARCH|nr:3'-5' exonuclease [Candidatus Mancarchaeum acidiphilum]ASI13893.1 DNA polymerase 3'-5' exonuclease subunit [Candidatus Mancarchaeum acidiphilum]
MALAIIDCETTGLKWYKNGIVSLGAVDITSDDKFYEECRVEDDIEVDETSLLVNGFKDADVKDPSKKSESEVLKSFINWCKYHSVNMISGFNVEFDISFLYGIAKRGNVDFAAFPKYYFDIKSIFERNVLMDISKRPMVNEVCAKYGIDVGTPPYVHVSMDKTLKFYNIDEDEPKPHLAINGAVFATELYFLMKYKTHYISRFSNSEIPDYLNALKFDFGPPLKVENLIRSIELKLKSV